MNFEKKKFKNLKSLVLSERPLYAAQFEERIAMLIPAMEASVDSFEDYHSAYDHCSKVRTVGLFFLHCTPGSKLPDNAIDELSAPFEAIDSNAGLYIVASDEKTFAAAYKRYGESERILGIVLESEIQADSAFKSGVEEALKKFENAQIGLVLPKAELEFFMKTARKYENLDTLHRLTHLMTYKLDRDWYDDLLVEAGPTLLCIPENQKWILNNSQSLSRLVEDLKPFANNTLSELISVKDDCLIARAVQSSFLLYQAEKAGNLESEIRNATQGTSAFAATLKKVLSAEKMNILGIFDSSKERKAV